MSPEEEILKTIINEDDGTPAERVARGCDLLDVHCEGWAQKIDLEHFDIRSTSRCVLGQVYGWYNEGLEEILAMLPYEEDDTDEMSHMSAMFGFESLETLCGHIPEGNREYEELQQLWEAAIGLRQMASADA